MPTARQPQPQRLWLHLLLLIVTLFSTTVVGMRYMANFQQGLFPLSSDADIFPYEWVWHNLSHLAMGLPFSLTLLGILLTHEFGHYFACRHYGIRATLPFLLPAPSLSGTAGAVIRLQSRVKSRAALLAIGAFGPIPGFGVALLTSVIGFALSKPVATEPQRLVNFHDPMLFRILSLVLGNRLHISLDGHLLWHPVLIASWIGLLITSLNLVPAGQLDGGHILYALSPRIHRVVTYAAIVLLIFLGIEYWVGWLLWAALLLLPGMRHPTVKDESPLPRGLLWLPPTSLAIFLLTATPQPFGSSSLLEVIPRILRELRS
jgi:Zn-dependent protease